jgi:hypothetical protein
MGVEIVLYCLYVIAGGIVANTAVGVVGEVVTTSKETNAVKYKACMANPAGSPSECKGLE